MKFILLESGVYGENFDKAFFFPCRNQYLCAPVSKMRPFCRFLARLSKRVKLNFHLILT